MAFKEIRVISEKFSKIGNEIIEKAPELEKVCAYIKAGRIKVLFLESNKAKKKTGGRVFGECSKVSDSMRWAVDADFTITIFIPNCEMFHFDSEKYKVLLLHELLHIGLATSDKGALQKYVVPHDVQEFSLIADKYGYDWSEPDKQLEFNFE
ncbi:MAG: hypothetical protein J6S67_21180 [Methanobrevibacter sp.]|nr:hypothetical protein [Methanobrevibacter sp.]